MKEKNRCESIFLPFSFGNSSDIWRDYYEKSDIKEENKGFGACLCSQCRSLLQHKFNKKSCAGNHVSLCCRRSFRGDGHRSGTDIERWDKKRKVLYRALETFSWNEKGL